MITITLVLMTNIMEVLIITMGKRIKVIVLLVIALMITLLLTIMVLLSQSPS